jgi:hypothetical protein
VFSWWNRAPAEPHPRSTKRRWQDKELAKDASGRWVAKRS